ncbi:hypothetical protein M0805_001821 [Coniferiporia weirii]|nr:hypothetical protein M0805_001821 [Coniferiporia weirii]
MRITDYGSVNQAWIEWDESGGGTKGYITHSELQERPSFRAARLVDDPERFLFLNFPRSSRAAPLRQYLLGAIKNGVLVNKKNYSFFGVTEPGIKEGWVAFFREDGQWSVGRALAMCGDLDKVFLSHGPGKYSARLGLSFSSTRATIDVPECKALKIPDLVAKDGTLTTDGCGLIRESAAKDIRAKLNVHPLAAVFQIRWAGTKGLFVAYPDKEFDRICAEVDRSSKPGQYLIAYRPSMLKYSGGPTIIDVNKESMTPPGAKLNHAFIVLLVTLGVKIKPFQDLLERQIQGIEAIGHDRQRALSLFESNSGTQETDYHRELIDMLQAGHEMNEPYLQSMIRRYQNKQYTSLLEKLHISIPKACYVFGIVDELGVLEDNEVYINLPASKGVLAGRVLVARNPSYLPSDIRVLKAVCRPELAFLRDCIVFPCKGKTSIPNLMAGGDLDGDKYFVCWDRTIFPSTKAIQKPEPESSQMPAPKPPLKKPRTLADRPHELVDMFVRQHDSALLGSASKEWKRVVEHLPGLANEEYPRKLSRVVAVALDLTKTGADHKQLEDQFRQLKTQYKSTVNGLSPSPLEPLRDQIPKPVDEKPEEYPIDPALKIRDGHETIWDEFYREGQRLIVVFNGKMRDAIQLKEQKVQACERPPGRGYRPKESSDFLADQLKEEFMTNYFQTSSDPTDRTNYIRASAWYCVGYERGRTAFAWLGARYLNELKAESIGNDAVSSATAVPKGPSTGRRKKEVDEEKEEKDEQEKEEREEEDEIKVVERLEEADIKKKKSKAQVRAMEEKKEESAPVAKTTKKKTAKKAAKSQVSDSEEPLEESRPSRIPYILFYLFIFLFLTCGC